MLLTVFAMAGLVSSAMVSTGAAAAADEVAVSSYPTCNATSANRVGTYRNGNWITLEVYWDGANGTNCAYLRHGSAAPGGNIRTFVDLWRCPSNSSGAYCPAPGPESRYRDRDDGYFGSYAGKVTVDGRNRCIYAWGGIDTNGDRLFDKFIDVNGITDPSAPPYGKHCA